MSDWEHLLCNTCWAKRAPLEVPHRLLRYPWRPCCECGTLTNSGILVRVDIASVKCNGEGPVHEEHELVAA
jgi:hypothetical protein